jgi:UDP-N-acetylglucosamine 2-epimerase (non-hydrolysing)
VLVAGDVNSTLAAALAAVKSETPVIHLEAGLRSGDWSMPEEVNRVLTDRVSRLLLCPSEDAAVNLEREGIVEGVEIVGNTMIDSLLSREDAADDHGFLAHHGIARGRYVLVTLHRPGLVDDPELLGATMSALETVAEEVPVLFPVHPRTRRHLEGRGSSRAVRLTGPLEYLEFLAVMRSAGVVVTDSGGVQEETSVLGVPCLTYRATTERPITTTHGTNVVIGLDPDRLVAECRRALSGPRGNGRPEIPLWDGEAGARAARSIERFLLQGSRQGRSA